MGQLIYTKTTFLIEEINAASSFTAPLKVCSDFKQAVAWAYVRLSEHQPLILDIAGQHCSIEDWDDHIYTGVYIVPTFPLDQPGLPMQIRVRAIEELTLSEAK